MICALPGLDYIFLDRAGVISLHQGIRKSFSELREEADLLASGLLAIGLSKGDRVAIWAPNCYEWCLSQLATAKAGMIMVIKMN